MWGVATKAATGPAARTAEALLCDIFLALDKATIGNQANGPLQTPLDGARLATLAKAKVSGTLLSCMRALQDANLCRTVFLLQASRHRFLNLDCGHHRHALASRDFLSSPTEGAAYGDEARGFSAHPQSRGAALLLQDMYTPLSMSMPNHEFVGPSGCDVIMHTICFVATHMPSRWERSKTSRLRHLSCLYGRQIAPS